MGEAVAVLGASGYTGGELIRLLDRHPALDLAYLGAHRRAGLALREVHPHLDGGDRTMEPIDSLDPAGLALAFLALPHGRSWEIGLRLAAAGIRVVDLGSDFRLDSPERYAQAYGDSHPAPNELGEWVYGLPELFGDELIGASNVAVPGCYPTAVALAFGPLVAAGLVDATAITVSAMSGVSGAGRSLRDDLLFGAVEGGVRAYGVAGHRHRPEMEQTLQRLGGGDVRVTFTPHLVPMTRGILATCTAPVREVIDAGALRSALRDAYRGRPFVEVTETPPSSRWVTGSNRCAVYADVDRHAGTAIVVSAIDNLLKGAAGQAVQCANLMLGLDESVGLPVSGWMP